METAIDLQHALATAWSAPDTDSGSGDLRGGAKHARLVVLHYDEDFARLYDVGGARHEWVVPAGNDLTDQPSWLPTTETNDTISPG